MSSIRSAEDEISSRTGEVLENANKHFKEGFDILNHEINIIRMELEACDKSAKKLEHVHFSKTLKLNIGGHLFSTSLETLSKDSESMLHAMFSGRFETKPSEDGSYFIDRDGTHFRYILNYLRTGQLIVPEDKIVRKELLAEAEFYQIGGIISELTGRPFKDSLIVPSILDQRQTLVNWLKDFHTNLHPVLLYRGSRDGWTGANLHSCCDNNKGPTLTVVKVYTTVNSSRQVSVCGGYTEEQWKGASAVTIKAADSFLFRFDFEKPVFSNAGSYPHSACCCLCRYGPVFSYGGDVVCVNAPNDSGNYTATLNDMSQKLSEMEVFGFNKK